MNLGQSNVHYREIKVNVLNSQQDRARPDCMNIQDGLALYCWQILSIIFAITVKGEEVRGLERDKTYLTITEVNFDVNKNITSLTQLAEGAGSLSVFLF